jgi:hypothetical protein
VNMEIDSGKLRRRDVKREYKEIVVREIEER